jgi:hypothetical protein
MTTRPFWAAGLLAAALLALPLPADAKKKSESAPVAAVEDDDDVPPAPPSPGPELNPFECYGRYQYATENRTIKEMRHELDQRLSWLDEPGQPDTVLAIKLCVIGKLKARVGDMDAWSYFERSMEADPVEPGIELWAAQYWTMHRGARRQVTEPGEKHYYSALRKLKAIKKAGRWKDYHTIVEDWIRRDLTVLYQMDGQPILPWKAYKQDERGLNRPGLSIGSQLRMSKDTRDFFFNSEYRQYTAEVAFANSPLRAGGAQDTGPIEAQKDAKAIKAALINAPFRLQLENKLRFRQRHIGTIDFLHTYLYQHESQVYNFYDPTELKSVTNPLGALPQFSSIQVQQVGLGYERVFPLYPLFDLRLAGTIQRGYRDGIVEFHPYAVYPILQPNGQYVNLNQREQMTLYELKPSISRFLGADKLTVNGVWAWLDFSDTPGAPISDLGHQKGIRALNFEYGLYQPLVLPTFDYGGLSTYRTPTRGLYFYGGLMEDGEKWGKTLVTARDFYGGLRFEGPHWTDFVLQGTYQTNTVEYETNNGTGHFIFSDPAQAFSVFRTTFVLQYRVRSYDTFPGMPPSHGGFGSDMLNLVFPVFWDKGLDGKHDYENVRVGAQMWTKLIGEGIGGTTFLVTAGVDYQYFYHLSRGVPMGQLAIRMGWGDL